MDAFGFYLIHSQAFINFPPSMDFLWAISKVSKQYLGFGGGPIMSLIRAKMTSFIFRK